MFYKPLAKAEIAQIVDLMLADLSSRLKDKQLHLELTPAATDYVIESGYDPSFGARPLKRFLQSRVETLLARRIIEGSLSQGDTVLIDYDGHELSAQRKQAA